MSALTKVFVVLLVIVSLLFVSGVVVFVNKVDDFGTEAGKAKERYETEKAANQALLVKVEGVRAEAAKAVAEATDRASVLLAANAQLQSKLNDIQTELAKREAEMGEIRTQLTSATTALGVAQQTNQTSDKNNTDLRNQVEDLEKKLTQAQVAASDLNNRLDAANLQVRYDKEQIAALETELKNAREKIASLSTQAPRGTAAPGAPGTPTPGPVAGPGTPAAPPTANMRGVVRNTFRVGDVQYATVGLGSADGVTKGTRFNVIDRNGNTFLGYLTVDTVEPNESSGHLTGPNVAAIQKGSPVMTSIQ